MLSKEGVPRPITCKRCIGPLSNAPESDWYYCDHCTSLAKIMFCSQCVMSWWCFPEYGEFAELPSNFVYPCNGCILKTVCMTCTNPDPNDMNVLLCDGCVTGAMCMTCAGLAEIPKEKWYCVECTRNNIQTPIRKRSKIATSEPESTPQPEAYDPTEMERFEVVLRTFLERRYKVITLKKLMEVARKDIRTLHKDVKQSENDLGTAVTGLKASKQYLQHLKDGIHNMSKEDMIIHSEMMAHNFKQLQPAFQNVAECENKVKTCKEELETAMRRYNQTSKRYRAWNDECEKLEAETFIEMKRIQNKSVFI